MKELYRQYSAAEKSLEQRQRELKEQRSQVRGEEALALERRITCLEAELGEVREVLDQLAVYNFR